MRNDDRGRAPLCACCEIVRGRLRPGQPSWYRVSSEQSGIRQETAVGLRALALRSDASPAPKRSKRLMSDERVRTGRTMLDTDPPSHHTTGTPVRRRSLGGNVWNANGSSLVISAVRWWVYFLVTSWCLFRCVSGVGLCFFVSSLNTRRLTQNGSGFGSRALAKMVWQHASGSTKRHEDKLRHSRGTVRRKHPQRRRQATVSTVYFTAW